MKTYKAIGEVCREERECVKHGMTVHAVSNGVAVCAECVKELVTFKPPQTIIDKFKK